MDMNRELLTKIISEYHLDKAVAMIMAGIEKEPKETIRELVFSYIEDLPILGKEVEVEFERIVEECEELACAIEDGEYSPEPQDLKDMADDIKVDQAIEEGRR